MSLSSRKEMTPLLRGTLLLAIALAPLVGGGVDDARASTANQAAMNSFYDLNNIVTVNITMPQTQWMARDFDLDGKADISVWRSSQAKFYTILSATNTVSTPIFGAAGDIPAIGDIDADIKADYGLWRPSTGGWDTLKSTTGLHTSANWGTNGDVPLPRPQNKFRGIEAVHEYLLGGTDYAALKQACDDSQGLDKEVYDMVIAKVGHLITSIQGRVGELIVRKVT